tara:strand:+ start:13 stop:1716 length:1704 start_codon:yes stop_codon:yes gene_type:complete
MAEDKNLLDKIRETASYYDKKVTDAINYVTPPPVRKIIGGLETLLPFQNIPDATEFIQNPSFKTGLDLATDTAITGAELTPLTYLASRGVTLPGKVAQEVTEGIRPVDDIINQKIVPKKNTEIDLNDVYTNPLKRKDRVRLRNEASNDKNLNELISQINKEKTYSEDTVSKFSNIYNFGDPFKIEYLRSMTENTFKTIMKKAKEKKLINDETISSTKLINDSKIDSLTDLRLGKLEEQLKKYKGANSKETGMNLRVNKFGEFDINDIFKLDDDLKYLVNNKDARQKILKKLEREGILDELGLTDINIKANKPKTISDPQIDKYLKDLNLNFLPKKFDFTTKILNPNQKEIYSSLMKKITNSIGTNESVRGIIRNNVNRMIKYGVRDQGKSIDEVMASLQKQTDNPEFLEKVIPLIQKKIKTQNYIKGIKKDLGIDLDSVDLSHMKAVVEDIDQTFKLNNLFIGLSKKNTAESIIQKNIRRLTNQLDEKGGSVANKNKIKADIEDLQYKLKTGDYYDAVSENYPSTSDVGVDVQKQIKEKISEAMMGEPTYFKKDGGMVGISHLTRPL